MDTPTALQHWPLQAIAALIAGVVVLLAPRALNYAVAAYLLVVGALGVSHFFYGQAIRPQSVMSLVAGVLILVKPNILSYVVGIYLILVGLLDSGLLRFQPSR
jgi:uncharacterized membrane protein HdeD (DUF308 family)